MEHFRCSTSDSSDTFRSKDHHFYLTCLHFSNLKFPSADLSPAPILGPSIKVRELKGAKCTAGFPSPGAYQTFRNKRKHWLNQIGMQDIQRLPHIRKQFFLENIDYHSDNFKLDTNCPSTPYILSGHMRVKNRDHKITPATAIPVMMCSAANTNAKKRRKLQGDVGVMCGINVVGAIINFVPRHMAIP